VTPAGGCLATTEIKMPTALGATQLSISVTLLDAEDEALSNAQTFVHALADDDGLLSEHEVREISHKLLSAYVAGDADPVE
jgi:hypothetical protein